eukprot:1804964-Rhodomonas_salina.2
MLSPNTIKPDPETCSPLDDASTYGVEPSGASYTPASPSSVDHSPLELAIASNPPYPTSPNTNTSPENGGSPSAPSSVYCSKNVNCTPKSGFVVTLWLVISAHRNDSTSTASDIGKCPATTHMLSLPGSTYSICSRPGTASAAFTDCTPSSDMVPPPTYAPTPATATAAGPTTDASAALIAPQHFASPSDSTAQNTPSADPTRTATQAAPPMNSGTAPNAAPIAPATQPPTQD